MRTWSRNLLLQSLAVATVSSSGCGGGPSVQASTTPSSVEVRVSAGAPVAGATVMVLAISDATGEVNGTAGAGGVLGSAGPTDSDGRATISLKSYSGPVQLVARGPALFYPDPTAAPDDAGVRPAIQVPSSFEFSSYVASFKKGTGTVVPVTLLTTLADHAALAYARGRHSSHPGRTTITEALAARDPLFVTHVTNAAAAWDPGNLRSTMPALIAQGPQSLVDVAFAALFDVGLNQLAHDTATRAGYGTGTGGLTAPTLVQLMEADLDADGRLDGIGANGAPIWTAGSTPVAVDTQFLRKPLAVSLAAWVRNVVANKSGITDADLASARVFKTITEDTSDLFGSAPIQPFDPLDRTPPVLAFAGSPPAYSATLRVTLTVSASDSSGVRAVYALVGATKQEATPKDGNWVLDMKLSSVGHNTVVIWAEDLAQPTSNSGAGMDGPYQLSTDIVYDPDPPAATYDSAFASYADETGLAVGVSADGLAIVPASYIEPARTAIANGGDIHKTATRLSGGGAMDAAELEGTNFANIPVLRFAVPFNAKTDSPITTAEFRVDVACAGCGTYPTVVGALLPSPTAAPGALLFDLPLSVEAIPALASVTSAAALTVTLGLADAAGNASTVGGFAFTFHVIGPPLAVTEDVAYPGYSDPRSTYPYRVSGQVLGVDTYTTLFNPASPAFFGGQVRLLRYVISNPSSKPVAVKANFSQAAGGSWKMTETWPRTTYADQPVQWPRNGPDIASARTLDGFTFYQSLYWATPYGTSGAQVAATETAPHPCGGTGRGTPAHRRGDGLNRWTCLPDTIWSASTVAAFSSSTVTPMVYRGPQQGGGEVVPPATDLTGTVYVVPGAVGATPGTLVIYLTRPSSAARTRPLVKNVIGNMNSFETYDYEAAMLYGKLDIAATDQIFTYDVYVLFKSGEYLQGASESIEGSFALTTQGLADARLFGEPATPFSMAYSRTIATH